MRDLLKASFWTALMTIGRGLSLLVVSKIISVEVGPDGLGKVGQFVSLMTILGVVAGGGCATGLVRFVAHTRNDLPQMKRYLGTALVITLVCSGAVALICIGAAYPLSLWLLGSDRFVSLIWILAIMQALIAGNNFLTGVLNGHKETQAFATANLLGLVSGLGLVYFFTLKFHLYGALLGLMFLQAMPFLFSALIVRTRTWWNRALFKLQFQRDCFDGLAHYSVMAIAAAVFIPGAQILIRNLIQHDLSWEQVGYWQASIRISDVFTMFMTLSLTAYYLPRISEARSATQMRAEVHRAFLYFVPLVSVTALVIYIFRAFFVRILFSAAFTPVENILGVQLFADVLRSCSWILAYLMLARSMSRHFFICEALFAFSYVLFSYLFIPSQGLIGVSWASVVTNAFYLVAMAIIFSNDYSFKTLLRQSDAADDVHS